MLRAVIGRNKTEFGPPRAPSAKSMRRGVGVLVDSDSGEALIEGPVRLWDLPELSARDLARALAGDVPAAHLLRFAHRDPEFREDGGYSPVAFG
ncbi:MAG: hypothetical protein WAL50_03500 [Kineosporiaceae bacterium]